MKQVKMTHKNKDIVRVLPNMVERYEVLGYKVVTEKQRNVKSAAQSNETGDK